MTRRLAAAAALLLAIATPAYADTNWQANNNGKDWSLRNIQGVTPNQVVFADANEKLSGDSDFTYAGDVLTLSSASGGNTTISLTRAGLQAISKSGSGGLWVGTSNAQQVTLFTGGLEQLTIASGGGVSMTSLQSAGASYVKASAAGLLSPQTGIPGTDVSLTATQLAYGSVGNTLTSEAALAWDATNDALKLGAPSVVTGNDRIRIKATTDATVYALQATNTSVTSAGAMGIRLQTGAEGGSPGNSVDMVLRNTAHSTGEGFDFIYDPNNNPSPVSFYNLSDDTAGAFVWYVDDTPYEAFRIQGSNGELSAQSLGFDVISSGRYVKAVDVSGSLFASSVIPGGDVSLTATQVAYGSVGNTITSEAALAYNATANTLTITGQAPLVLGGGATGVKMAIRDLDNIANYAQIWAYPNSGTNVGSAFNVVPRGTGFSSTNKASFSVYNTDGIADATNVELVSFYAAGTDGFVLATGKAGTGVNRSLMLSSGFISGGALNANQLVLDPDGGVRMAQTSSTGVVLALTKAGGQTIEKQGTGSFFVGTLGAQSLGLYTNNVTRELFDSAGKVQWPNSTGMQFDEPSNVFSIGIASPASATVMHLKQSGSAGTNLYIQNPSTSASAYMGVTLGTSDAIFGSGSYFGFWMYGPNLTPVGNRTPGTSEFLNAGGTGNMLFNIAQSSGDFIWSTGGAMTEKMRFTIAGALRLTDSNPQVIEKRNAGSFSIGTFISDYFETYTNNAVRTRWTSAGAIQNLNTASESWTLSGTPLTTTNPTVSEWAITPPTTTAAASMSAVWAWDAITLTLSGATTTANTRFAAFFRPTITDSSGHISTKASTVWIENCPAVAGSQTITAGGCYALDIEAGVANLGGGAKVGTLTGMLRADTGTVSVASLPGAATVLVSGGATATPTGDSLIQIDTVGHELSLNVGALWSSYNLTGSDFEFVQAAWVSNEWRLTSKKIGAGTVRNMKIDPGTAVLTLAGNVTFSAAGFKLGASSTVGYVVAAIGTDGSAAYVNPATSITSASVTNVSDGLPTSLNAATTPTDNVLYIANSGGSDTIGAQDSAAIDRMRQINYYILAIDPVDWLYTSSLTATSATGIEYDRFGGTQVRLLANIDANTLTGCTSKTFTVTRNGSNTAGAITRNCGSAGKVDSGWQSTSGGSTDGWGIKVTTSGSVSGGSLSGAFTVLVR